MVQPAQSCTVTDRTRWCTIRTLAATPGLIECVSSGNYAIAPKLQKLTLFAIFQEIQTIVLKTDNNEQIGGNKYIPFTN